MRIELTEDEWMRVLNLIGGGPYVQVKPLIDKMVEQFQAQKKAETPTPPPTKEKLKTVS